MAPSSDQIVLDATYQDPKGRFSFRYPSGWFINAGEDGNVSVTVQDAPDREDDRMGIPKLLNRFDVYLGPSEHFGPKEGGRATSVDGEPATAWIEREGDASLDEYEFKPPLRFTSDVVIPRGVVTFLLEFYSNALPASEAEQLHQRFLDGFHIP